MGGPDLYVQVHGHPRLKSRHFPFKIGTVERDQWVACFMQALGELEIDAEIQAELLPPIYTLAEWMRNQEDVVEGAPLPPMQDKMPRDYVINRLVQLAHKYDVPVVFISTLDI
jgi:hemoglobin